MSVTDQLLADDDRDAAGFTKGDLPPSSPRPGGWRSSGAWTHDSTQRVLGLEEGGAHVIRNAGEVRS